MAEENKSVIIIAETAPVILSGFCNCIRRIHDFRHQLHEVVSKNSLLELIKTSHADLLIVNPTFGGVFNPENIRSVSLNPDIKIFAIEMGKLSNQILSLYDDHLHATDDMETISAKVKEACSVSSDNSNEKETLSSREKEIVSYVVKGFTNQEIADKLFLSIHTVITHRRNIAKKLEIHSATGLTIYAIVNKIVDLSDIKF